MNRVLGRRVLSGKSVFKLNRGARIFLGHKTIMCFEQGEAIDYNETFFLIVKPMSYQPIFAFSAACDDEMVQKGHKTAFLHGDIGEEYYTESSPGRIDGTRHVCKPKNDSTA